MKHVLLAIALLTVHAHANETVKIKSINVGMESTDGRVVGFEMRVLEKKDVNVKLEEREVPGHVINVEKMWSGNVKETFAYQGRQFQVELSINKTLFKNPTRIGYWVAAHSREATTRSRDGQLGLNLAKLEGLNGLRLEGVYVDAGAGKKIKPILDIDFQ